MSKVTPQEAYAWFRLVTALADWIRRWRRERRARKEHKQ